MPIKYNPAPCTQEYLRETFDYSPCTGELVWKVWRGGTAKVGTVAGKAKGSHGYGRVSIYGRHQSIHRIIWLWWYGEWPYEDIDHINGDRKDNRIANLRTCTRRENTQNAVVRSDSTNSKKGVKFHPDSGRWSARIGLYGKSYYLGSFDTEAEAHAAYRGAKTILHNFNPTQRE